MYLYKLGWESNVPVQVGLGEQCTCTQLIIYVFLCEVVFHFVNSEV